MKEYNVNSKIKKLSRPEIWIILFIILGLFKYIFILNRTTTSLNEPFKFLDYFALPIVGIGIILLWNIKSSIKKIRGSYIKTDENSFSFKSRGIELKINQLSEMKELKLTNETIKITAATSNEYLLFLDDYINKDEQEEIRAYFKSLKERQNL